MKKEDCFELGYIRKTHGLEGEVTAFFDVDDPELYIEIESVFIEQKNQLVPYLLEYIHPLNKEFLLKLEDIDDKDTAETLTKSGLYLPLTMLPELEDGQYYYHEIIGFLVKDEQKGELGKVKTVYSSDMQALIVMDYQSKEVLIPINDEVVKNVDKSENVVNVNLPDGLIELYLEEE